MDVVIALPAVVSHPLKAVATGRSPAATVYIPSIVHPGVVAEGGAVTVMVEAPINTPCELAKACTAQIPETALVLLFVVAKERTTKYVPA